MSLIEKLDGVLAAVSPLSSKSTPTDVMRASAKALDLLRDHGPAIRQAMIDAERLDFIERNFSGMTNCERYLPVRMIWGKGCNGRTLREACDKYMARATGEGEGNG